MAISARRAGVFALAGIALAGTTAAAAAQTVEFRGSVTIVATTNACTEAGWVVGEEGVANMRYRPPNLGDNGKDTRIAVFFPFYGMSFVLEKGSLGSAFKPVVAGATGSATWIFEEKAGARLTALSPAKITTKTKQVTIAGELRGVDEIPACILSFSGKLAKH